MKQVSLIILIAVIITLVFSPALPGQEGNTDQPGKEETDDTAAGNGSNYWIALLIGLLGGGGIIAIIQFVKRIKDARRIRRAEMEEEELVKEDKNNLLSQSHKDKYITTIKKELGYIDLLGSPDIENRPVKLEDAFVSLCISEYWRSERRFEPGEDMKEEPHRHLPPEIVMKRAFQKFRLLLVIGDPGSGKTTLVKYYAVNCLDTVNRGYTRFGFSHDVLPLYFPLRELEFKGQGESAGAPISLPQSLAKWADRHLLKISAKQFLNWLANEKTLVLLDGLDEISSKEKRKAVCNWIKDMVNGLDNVYFVVTSRATGYRKLDGIELEVPHLRADIMDFSPVQQADFLKKWFRAVGKAQLPPPDLDMPEKQWQARQEKEADQRSKTIIEFLNREDNQSLRELAAVPMLLQIMAIIWKYSRHLPQSRSELYDVALNYLLDYRDRHRDIYPLLRAEKARRVLKQNALWMQEKLKKDEVAKEKMHKYMQPILNTLDERPQALAFCDNLRERAGVIAEYDRNHYIFRHKSFREFLAALQLAKEAQQKRRIKTLVDYFKEDWWEETLRFFITQTDDEIFNHFMHALFQSPVSRHLDDNKQTLLHNLVIEAPQKTITALEKWLNSGKLNDNQGRYVMDCLKTIGTPEALAAVKNADKTKMDKSSREYAEDIISEAAAKVEPYVKIPGRIELENLDSFRNFLEGGVEYIKIPGGTYKYSVTGKKVIVPDLYFCKYPVTNQRYRRFIGYLQGKDKEFEKILPVDRYAQILLTFAVSIDGYAGYLDKQIKKWQEEFRSYVDDNKKYNGDDQPVVAVTWYASRAYCFWLSCLNAVLKGDSRLGDIKMLSETYRLPTEVEWEWAAGGKADGSMRIYPWPENKGEPNPELANYDNNVGATTPVGRYPDSATHQGLMDMAGNVWEWMENLYREDKPWRAIRGGSWHSAVSSLRCAARNNNNPDNRNNNRGFRVARSQSCPAGIAGSPPAKPGPGAGVLRNTGLVFGHDMTYGTIRLSPLHPLHYLRDSIQTVNITRIRGYFFTFYDFTFFN
jgi:formylglycine-generating enzyme required for sulfatase activity